MESNQNKEINLININRDSESSREYYKSLYKFDLDNDQLSDLSIINCIISREAKDSAKRFHNKRRKSLKKKVKNFRRYLLNGEDKTKKLIALVLLAWLVTLILYTIFSNCFNLRFVPSDNKYRTVIDIDMNNVDNELDYKVNSLAINTNNKQALNLNNITYLNNSIDTKTDKYTIDDVEYTISKNTELQNFIISADKVYLQNLNEEKTAGRELIITNEIIDELSLDDLDNKGLRFKEKNSNLQLKATSNSYGGTLLMLVETLAGGEIEKKSLIDEIKYIEDNMTVNKDTDVDILLRLNGLPDINLGNLNIIKGTPEVVYANTDKIMRVYDKESNQECFSISYLENKNFGCEPEKLVATNIENVFIHMDFGNQDKIGYRTLAIKADDNIYGIRFNGTLYESLKNELFNQIGISNDELQVKKVQKVVEKQ